MKEKMANENNNIIDEGKIHFSIEGRLLQELGERLVVSADLAINELIKNAYDADSPICKVSLINDEIVIEDEGHGMTFDEFKSNWMTIATSSKSTDRTSRKYKRKLTGAKGIGRFAVRYLGKTLTLEAIAYDENEKSYTKLEAKFDWEYVDKLSTLEEFEIPYKLFKLEKNVQTGVTLIIGELRNEVIDKYNIKSEVLKIVSPLSGLSSGSFKKGKGINKNDPGFAVSFLEGFETGEEVDINLAENILENCWAKLNINLVGKDLKFEVDFNYSDEKNEPYEFKTSFNNNISNGIYADIRFFPKRAGIFHGKDINGKIAWTWVRDNAGVGVIDHGFRIKPYGFMDDDWLNLDVDHSHSERNWRSDLMKDNFPMSEEQKKSPSFNPMLNISVNFQLVGAVFVESYQIGQKATSDLIPAMDREGFISNKGLKQLSNIVRTGIEYLALVDKKEELKKADKKAEQATSDLRKDIKIAIKEIELNEAIPQSERTQIIETYSRLYKEIETVDEYHKTSRENLELVSLLGIVSGYMTHETEKILDELKTVKQNLEKISKQYPQFKETSITVNNSIEQLELQIGYSTQFIDSLHRKKVESFHAKVQIEYVLEKFGDFAFKKGIQHKIEIDDELLTPPLHVAMYSGIFLNLYTNAVKAILMKDINPNEGKILIRAVNLREKHILEVFDNGVGIPESLKERIWDPLFTTTSRLNSPLGTGMGLGLSLVKRVLGDIKATIKLVDPIQDYVTTIRVEYILNPFERR